MTQWKFKHQLSILKYFERQIAESCFQFEKKSNNLNLNFLEAVDIMRGHLATKMLLDGAVLLKVTHNCKLYWKKGNLLSASGEFDIIFGTDVKTMLLPQGVCIVEVHVNIERQALAPLTCLLKCKLLVFHKC